MSKLNKHVPESDTISDKLRVSLNTENNKPDTVKSDHGSPITPLQSRPSGLTSATTTTTTSSCSSSSSGSVTKKPDIGRSNLSAAHSKPSVPSAAQSASTNLAGVQQKSTSTSATQSSKSTTPSAAQSKSNIPSGGKPSSSAAKSGSSSQKTASGNLRPSRGSATSNSVSSKSSTQPQQVKMVPTGTLFPSGKVQITGMAQGTPTSKVLGPGAKFYGYGSIMKGCRVSTTTSGSSSRSLVIAGGSDADTMWKKVMSSTNPEEVKRLGNQMFREGCFTEALKLYDRALQLSPINATYHSNRAAALSGLGRIGEAVIECEEAIKLDPNFARAHHSLATLLLRLGQVDNAGKHFFLLEAPSDPMVVKLIEKLDKHLKKCADARKHGEWNIVLSEASAAMASGADWSPQLAMCKVEALLKLLRLDDAQKVVAFVPKVEPIPASFSETRFFDMIAEAYTCFVKSQMELALGRFENAVTAAEKASEIDPRNSEVETWYINIRMIAKARDRGNDLYESERYTEASAAYAEGLKLDPFNATLFYQRADCFFKVGMYESSIQDCNHTLNILPSYIKALLQRAESYSKLERWVEAVRDYQTLRKELSYDKVIAESLFRAQVALKKSRGEIVLNMEFKGEVEEISSLEEFRAALTRPGVSIVHYFRAFDQQCKEMSMFMDALCIRYPSLHFLKVDIEKYPEVADAEKVRVVPTFKIYKLGIGIKEIVCPSKEALENSFRHYGL